MAIAFTAVFTFAGPRAKISGASPCSQTKPIEVANLFVCVFWDTFNTLLWRCSSDVLDRLAFAMMDPVRSRGVGVHRSVRRNNTSAGWSGRMMIRRSCKQGAVENNLCGGNNSPCQQQIGRPLEKESAVR